MFTNTNDYISILQIYYWHISMRTIKKHPQNNIYLTIQPQEEPKRGILLGKPFSHQNVNIKSFNQFRSASRNHQRLRSHLLKKKVNGQCAQFFSPDQKYKSPDRLTKVWNGIESKSTQKSQTEAQMAKEKVKETDHRMINEQNSKKVKSNKKQFKQIRNVKKQQLLQQTEVRLLLNGQKINQKKEQTEKNENIEIIYKKLKISINEIRLGFRYQQENHIQNSDKKSDQSCANDGNESVRSLNLQLESKLKPKLSFSLLPEHFLRQNLSNLSTIEKIQNHLDIIERLSIFVDQSRNFYKVSEQWLEVNFLIYKKYYIQRVKVLNFLKKYPMKNPFIIENAEISSKEIIQFMKTKDGTNFKGELEIQNKMIKQKLQCYYNEFNKNIVGEKINLHQSDNFSRWIIDDLWAETILTQHNTDHSQQNINIRLCKILQVIFMISELNGKAVMNFKEAEYAIKMNNCKEYIQQAKTVFKRQLLYKQY